MAFALVPVLFAVSALSSAADGLTFTGGSAFHNGSSYSVGSSFTLDAPLSVASPGWYDTGVWTSAPVGIYDASATLLTSTMVLKTDVLLASGFRYTSLGAPLVLAVGTYRVVGTGTQFYCEGGNVPAGPIALSTAPHVAYGAAWYRPSSPGVLTYASVPGDRGKGYFGPNFNTEPVPEPASVAALALGGLAVLRRRRR